MSDYNINFSAQNKNYDLSLKKTDVHSKNAVTVGGRSYEILGGEEALSLVKKAMPHSSLEFETITHLESFLKENIPDVKVNKFAEKIASGSLENLKEISLDKREVAKTQIIEYLESVVKTQDFRGSVSVVRGGEPLIDQGFGIANDKGDKITDTTIFHLASVSKQFTAVATLLLEQQGKLSVDEPISKYLPKEFKDNPRWEKVTIHQLLNNTSGIPGYDVDENPKEYEPKEIIKEIENKDLKFEPGTAWEYSNSGYALLGVIIEHVSQQSYGDFMKENIFGKLGMSSSGYGSSYNKEDAAVGYQKGESSSKLSQIDKQEIHLSKAFSSGGLYSCSKDMKLWDAALYDEKFLKPESREKMFKIVEMPPHDKPEARVGYGYGFFLAEDPKVGLVAFHEGHVPGFASFISRYPKTHDCILVLSNNYEISGPEIGFKIEDILSANK